MSEIPFYPDEVLDPIAEMERLSKELSRIQKELGARVYDHRGARVYDPRPIPTDPDKAEPDNPDSAGIISAVTKEIKEAYGQGHDDGYRGALHDVEAWLRRTEFKIPTQLANEISTGTWRNTK